MELIAAKVYHPSIPRVHLPGIEPGREHGGTAVAIDDQEIRDETAASGRLGLTIGYESAALISALQKMRNEGQVKAGEKILLLFTATHLIPLGQRVP